jgi:predicted Ser/Thr protein kinase
LSEIEQILEAYRAGKSNDAGLESSLKNHLANHPDEAAVLLTMLNKLLREGVLSETQHDALTITVQAPVPASQDLPPGTIIRDRFVLEAIIGRGGMSVVYRARDRRREEANDRNNLIAIKILGPQFREHPDAYTTLQREARRAQQLAHPNITTVYDFDREADTPYLCMELLTGRSLEEILRQSPDAAHEDAQHIIEGMARGLEYAHGHGIVHADFKPANVFITDDNQVKILDFGIARVVPTDDHAV